MSKEQSSQSSVSVEEPSTSTAQPEEEEDLGLTDAARKKKEKKEKKEKALQALQALQASRKPSSVAPSSEATSEVASVAQSEASSEPASRAQSEAPSRAQSEAPPEAPSAAQSQSKVEEVAEDFDGLGLTGSRKKKPRKKKTDPIPPIIEASVLPTQTTPVTRPTTQVTLSTHGSAESAPGSTGTAPVHVQMPEVLKSDPPGPWGKGAPQSASAGCGRGRGWAPVAPDAPVAPAIRSFPVPIPTPTPLPQPSSSSQTLVGSKIQTVKPPAPSGRSLEPVLCRYKIPTKIPDRSVRAHNITVLVNYLPMQFKDLKIVSCFSVSSNSKTNRHTASAKWVERFVAITPWRIDHTLCWT